MENRFLITYHPSFMMPWLEMVRPGWSWFALAGAGSPWLELVHPCRMYVPFICVS
jgi:hypothetical protein